MNKPTTQIVLACQQLNKSFHDGVINVDVLHDINLQIMAGERIALVGASGSGKSTLLHILGGLDEPSNGLVLVNNQNFSTLNEVTRCQLRNQNLGFIYQFHHLLPEFNALENVCMPLLIRGTKPAIAKEKAMSLLEQVGLSNRYLHKLGELSGGERQRAAIARALVTDPLCVLADEPTGNLDQRNAERVYELMLQLNSQLNTSFLIATHDMRLAAQMDRTLTLVSGYLTEE